MKVQFALTAAVVALIAAAPAIAQNATSGVRSSVNGVQTLDDRIDDIQTAAKDDIAEGNDGARFGQNQYAQGWTGSLALGFTGTTGNTDTADLDLAGRFRYGDGPWNHTVGFAAEFAQDNGVRNKEEVFLTYDVNRYVDDSFYVFGLASAHYDKFDSNKIDAFVGFGPGYRVLNTPNQTWRAQAGPGVRYLETKAGTTTKEVAGIVSSRYYYKVNETVFLTNDSDVLFSNADTFVTNDFGVNFKLSDKMSTRVSYRTEWDSNPLPGVKATDNALGVALVVGF